MKKEKVNISFKVFDRRKAPCGREWFDITAGCVLQSARQPHMGCCIYNVTSNVTVLLTKSRAVWAFARRFDASSYSA